MLGLVFLPVGVSVAQPAGPSTSPATPVAVVANDNLVPAGELKDGVLTLRLVATVGRWQPEGQGANDPARIVQVFAEEGKAPQIPGPLSACPRALKSG